MQPKLSVYFINKFGRLRDFKTLDNNFCRSVNSMVDRILIKNKRSNLHKKQVFAIKYMVQYTEDNKHIRREVVAMTKVKLTDYAVNGGCACKLGPQILEEVLRQLPVLSSEKVLVGLETSDDAGVYQLTDELALVQTVDFFMPLVDDPYTFGQIAAANSLSDIYAMGGTPCTALNLVAFPVPLVKVGALQQVLAGSGAILSEAGVVLLGGHSIEDETPKYGLAVTGTVHPQQFWTNKGAQVGDSLVLTKPLGTGIMTTAMKGDLFPQGTEEAVQSMITLNKTAALVGRNFTIHACTDVTGFGLFGHGSELARAAKLTVSLNHREWPLFTDVIEAASMGLIPAGAYRNRQAVPSVRLDEPVSAVYSDIGYDPQTSGGLLFCLPGQEARDFVMALVAAGVKAATIIGTITKQMGVDIYVR